MRHILGRYLHLCPRFRIAPVAGRSIVQAEAPEPSDLDALALNQTLRYRVEYRLHGNFHLLRGELRVMPDQPCNQLALSHRAVSPYSTPYVRERDNRREVRQFASIARERRVRLLSYA